MTDLDRHRSASQISDVILGGQDGLVNVLGVILGVAAASEETRLVIAAGLAATFAESISMGAVAYTSRMADAELYESERSREYRHIERQPDMEKEEIRAIYAKKGFSGSLLDRIVETITANKDVWVAVMMTEEHELKPISRSRALRAALIVGLSALVGSFVPLIPFMLFPLKTSMMLAMVLSAAVLFSVGAYKAYVTSGHWGRRGAEIAVIGIVSALAGYAIGLAFSVPSG
jgi:vacuolar iron transporter family protein